MREIKFRGKRYNGYWVYGDLCMPANRFASIRENKYNYNGVSHEEYEVIEDTIGQFTGLYDKNQKPIYEGDIVLQQGYHGKKIPMVVKFECGAFIVGYHEGSSTKRRPMLLNSQCQVIGNVFDNSNLLEE